MSHAEILLEDVPDGKGAAVKYKFTGGYDPASAAHQLARIVMQHIESLTAPGEGVLDVAQASAAEVAESAPAEELLPAVDDSPATLQSLKKRVASND